MKNWRKPRSFSFLFEKTVAQLPVTGNQAAVFVCGARRISSATPPCVFLGIYQMCIRCCIKRLTAVMPAQQQAPSRRGFPPVFISLTMLLPRPMAAIAMLMKNLLSSFSGANKEAEIPK